MDIRAFGAVYGQTSMLPYGSGFGWVPSDGVKRFSTCRAIYVMQKSSSDKGYLSVELSDAPGQAARANHLTGGQVFPIACTALLSGTVEGVVVLY
jgi:hypothetical protein